MLKSWSISHFKPIVQSGELHLAPLTVLAGLNSSGKSSLLQSILVITQTLSNRVLDRPLLPNGPIIQLGTFDNILTFDSLLEEVKPRTLTVSFELEVEREPIKTPSVRSTTEERQDTKASSQVKSVRVTAEFRSTSSNGTSTSAIESQVEAENISLQITYELKTEPAKTQASQSPSPEVTESTFNYFVRKVSQHDLNSFLENVSPDDLRFVPSSIRQSSYLGELVLSEKKESTPYLVALSHFLPTRLVEKFKREERRRQAEKRQKVLITSFLNFIFNSHPEFASYPKEVFSSVFIPNGGPEPQLPKEIKESINKYCKDMKITPLFSGKSLYELITWYGSLKGANAARKRAIGKALHGLLDPDLLQIGWKQEPEKDSYTEGLEAVTNDLYVSIVEQATEQINRFFTSKIRYLGPLRPAPDGAQGFPLSSELDDVGPKGDYAAAVYDTNRDARIKWFNPDKGRIEQNTLEEALDHWARYLGVAERIDIATGGQSGVTWQITRLKGQRPLPLTAVGVGVSQILPILVMGLLAPSNSLLIVEQPELHLHPRVQSRLGDFFLGLAKCKKQCLVETHSENLVQQLRSHVVQSGGLDKSDCMIYFVSQDEKGASNFSPVEISPQGNILNWPDGFFDETMLQEDRITAESIKRRAKLSKV